MFCGTKIKPKRLTALVSGRVQGVSYRAFARRYAIDKDLSGYAENLSDGRVEVVAEGLKEDLDHFLIHLKNGPTYAEVSSIEVQWSDVGGLKDFYIY